MPLECKLPIPLLDLPRRAIRLNSQHLIVPLHCLLPTQTKLIKNNYYFHHHHHITLYYSMKQEHIWRIVQSILALVLLIFTIVYWKGNHIGENIINFEAVVVWAIGLEQIVIPFRWILNKQAFEYESSLLLFSVYIIGKLFELYNPSHVEVRFNVFCKYNIVVPLAINLIFVLVIMLVVLLYAVRHIYRLLTEKLLSTNSNLEPEELTRIMEMRKPFEEVEVEDPDVNRTCSICLCDFEADTSVIALPVCTHCFHPECIENWLETKATCPYCRNNIRLSLI